MCVGACVLWLGACPNTKRKCEELARPDRRLQRENDPQAPPPSFCMCGGSQLIQHVTEVKVLAVKAAVFFFHILSPVVQTQTLHLALCLQPPRKNSSAVRICWAFQLKGGKQGGLRGAESTPGRLNGERYLVPSVTSQVSPAALRHACRKVAEQRDFSPAWGLKRGID